MHDKGYTSLKITVIVLICCIIALIYKYENPISSNLFPKCIFFSISGYKCPGCGTQRALHSLFNYDINAAIKHNALFVMSIPFIALLMAADLLKHTHPHFYSRMNNKYVIWITLIVILMWWITRNIFGW